MSAIRAGFCCLLNFLLLLIMVLGIIAQTSAAEIFEDQFETPVTLIPLETGIWSISGNDSEHGSYTGTLEVRETQPGQFEVIRLISFNSLVHSDGRAIDLVWTGTVIDAATTSPRFRFTPLRADFIVQVGALVRTAADAQPLEVIGHVSLDSNQALQVEYTATTKSTFAASETGSFQQAPGVEPIWQSQRITLDAQSEPDFVDRVFWFNFYDSYHDLPVVQAFTNNPLFERAVQLQIIDMTDFDFYRANPNRLRVINKIVDAISLAETELRANAFRAAFAAKAEFYQQGLDNGFIDSEGLVLAGLDANGLPIVDTSSALWTGIYAYTQALRFLLSGDSDALDNIRSSLAGLFTLMDITNDPRQFARALRPIGPPVIEPWRRGSGEFAHLDWHAGGNNDMSKGLLLGMIAGWEVLPLDDPLRNEISSHALALLELCVFIDDPPSECGDDDDLGFGIPSANPGTAQLLAGITNNNPTLINQGLDSLNDPLLIRYADRDEISLGVFDITAGPFYEYGIGSDWSGNHLTLTTTLVLQWLLARTTDVELAQRWNSASGKDWRELRRLESPVHAAHAIAIRSLDTNPTDFAEATEQVLRGLRSFHLPKPPYLIDHRISGNFVLSTYPSLPWKQDWETNPERQQSIRNYPLIEHAPDAYGWNDAQFLIFSGLDGRTVPGVDYLFFYWLARIANVISATD